MNAPLRILVVAGRLPVSSEPFIRDQCAGLVARGHDVTILTLRPGDGSWSDGDRAAGLPERTRCARIDQPWPTRILLGIPRLVRLGLRSPATALASVSPRLGWRATSGQLLSVAASIDAPRHDDIILCHFGPMGRIALLARQAGLVSGKLVVGFYGYDITREIRQRGSEAYRALFDDADLLLPNSLFLAQRLRDAGAPAAKISLHRLGIDRSRFAPVDRSQRSGPPIALAVGRLVEKKGFEYLIAALAEAGRQSPWRLRIAGDGNLRMALESQASQLGVADRIEFLGWRSPEQVLEDMRAADLLVVPSVTAADGDMEGMPLVIAEAMSTGLPILGTRHSGIPEAVRDGRNGRIVAERDAPGLAAALRAFETREARLTAGKHSLEIAASEFDHDRQVDRLEALLRTAAETVAPRP